MKNFFLVITAFLLFSTSACKSDRIEIEGVQRLDIPICEMHPLREYRVEDQSSFNILLQGFIDGGVCEPFTIPTLDFDELSVIGFETLNNFCENDYSVSVDANPDDEIYEYTVNVRLNAECTELERRMHWISLPKIPAEFMVEYRQVEN